MRRLHSLLGLALVGAVAIVGCGGDGSTDAGPISDKDAQKVSNAEMAFSFTILDGSYYGQTLDGVDNLIEICRKDPKATYEDRTMLQVVEDAANELRGYQGDLSDSLELVARNKCG